MGGSVGTILQANNITHVAKAEYRQKVQVTAANNRLSAARTTLSEFARTLGNQMRMEAAGKEYNYAQSQLSHELEQSGKANLNAQLQNAEAQGALQAQAGAAGVGGASVELMDTLMDLRQATKAEQLRRGVELMAANGKRQTAQIVLNAQSSMDLQQSIGQFDYSQYIEPVRMKRRLGKLIGVAVATYFGGPQAGEAAADFEVGTWQASNGDFQGSNASFGNAMRGAAQAYKDWGERGGQSWFSSVTQGGGKKQTQTKQTEVSGDSGSGSGYVPFFSESEGSSGWNGWGW